MDRTVQANAVITMNIEPAREKVKEFKDLLSDANKELADLRKKPVELRTNEEAKRIKELTEKEIPRLTSQLEKAEKNLKNFRDTLQHLDKASINDLTNAKKALNDQIRRLTPGTKEYIASTEDFKKVNERLSSLNAAYKQVSTQQQGFFGTIKGAFGWFNKYWGGLTMLSSALTGLSTTFRKCAEDAAKLDDVYADVMKTTGLLHDQVAELDAELKKIDTRTSREQLLLLARDAGKLGIQGRENILGFVRAANQIQVALGEDLGEGAIKQLGKIADVYGLTQSMGIEKALLSIGSAVNALGQASTASEGYLVEFTQRLAGVGAMAGISVQDIKGFASGLDQSSMKVEMAATAFQKFLMKMYEDTGKFANYAGMEVEKFSDLLKNDANTAITTVLKSLHESGGFDQLVPMFKEMGLDGARAVQVLAAMAKNLTAVTDAQALANVEFEKATSVTDEYTVKNNNLQAQLEKARKKFKNASIALGQSLNPIMLKSTEATTYLIKALAQYGKEIRNAAIAVGVLTLAIKTKNIVQGISNAMDAVSITLTKTKVVVVNLAKLAYFKWTKQAEAAAVAQAALNGAMSASVFGLVALAVGALTVAVTKWVQKAKEANAVAKKMAEIEKTINSEYIESASRVQALSNIVHNNNLQLDERRRALDKLKEIVPGYHADLIKEGELINDNTEALKEYLINLEKATRAKVLNEEYEKAVAGVLNAEKELEKAKKAADEENVKQGGTGVTKKTVFRPTGPGAYVMGEEKNDYGQALDVVTEKTEALTQAQQLQLEIEQQINNELGQRAGKLSDEEAEIRKVNEKYKQLINDAHEENRDNPAQDERIELLREQQRKEIEEIRKNYAEKAAAEKDLLANANDILTQAQFDYLIKRQDKLTKKEKEMVAKGYASLSKEESEALKKRYEILSNIKPTTKDSPYKQAIKDLQDAQREEENDLKEHYINNKLTTEEYQKQMREINIKYLVQQVELAKEYGEDETAALSAYLDAEIAAADAAQKELDALYKERDSWQKEVDDEFKVQQERLEWLKQEAEKIKESLLSQAQIRELDKKNELELLDSIYKAKLLSEEEFQTKRQEIIRRYNQENLADDLDNISQYFEAANKIASGASDFITALREAESASLEAEYQKQLTAAGDNAEKREAIEADFEQKQLDLKKKYADTEMAINIAKTVANGAVAIIKAIADNGYIIGGIMSALITASTAAEVATIVKQREAIRNASAGSTGSSVSTGQRVMTGYAGGGFTENQTTVTTVGEEGTEWIAPHWMVNKNPVMFRNLERYRRAGSHGRSGSVSRGFADGGYTSSPSGVAGQMASATDEIDWQTMREFNAILRYCAENGLFVKYGDIMVAREKFNSFKKQTSRT